MRDPHVVALYYLLKHSGRVAFKDPPALSLSMAKFDVLLDDGTVQVALHEHFATSDGARQVVEPFLHSWELQMAVESGRKDVWFEFDRAEIIDRDPPAPGESYVAQMEGGSYFSFGCTAELTAWRNSYPEPDPNFVASPDVEAMWFRFEQYVNRREPLPSMANACLTLLEGSGSRAAACASYGFAQAVLGTLGRLVSTKGDVTEARKLDSSSTRTPFTPRERQWIEDVVRRMIRRKGEYDANPAASFKQIGMSDLPKL